MQKYLEFVCRGLVIIPNRRQTQKIFIVLLIISILVYSFSNYYIQRSVSYVHYLDQDYQNTSEFLVDSPKCKIFNLAPFNEDAKRFYYAVEDKPCRNKPLLTYVFNRKDTSSLYIDVDAIPYYSSKGVVCCYSNVTRGINTNDPDSNITISACQDFEMDDEVIVGHEPVMVKCRNRNGRKVYENVHMAITPTDDVKRRLNTVKGSNISVLLIGIDSISRLNFIRTMPKTYRYLSDNDNWLPLLGYNKMEDNTYPNLMAILTGYNADQAEACNPTEFGKIEKCPLMWNEYRKHGYVTAYGEDGGLVHTFNYGRVGFKIPPTDYYFRPYILATEMLPTVWRYLMTYCTGPENVGERLMNLAIDFSITFKNDPSFGLFWMNSFSHNDINSPTMMDGKVKNFLERLTKENIIESSIIIFFSDHGIRFGDIRLTNTGWLEERLPFIYFSFPKWFKNMYPDLSENFRSNAKKLTSPYDIYMTLQHILILQGKQIEFKNSSGCPTCMSLFYAIPLNRTCEQAGIAGHWCTCYGYKDQLLPKELSWAAGEMVVNEINSVVGKIPDCIKYNLVKVRRTAVANSEVSGGNYLLIFIATYPRALFEATLKVAAGDTSSAKFSLSGTISRTDFYYGHDFCVKSAMLKKYCYCRKKKSD